MLFTGRGTSGGLAACGQREKDADGGKAEDEVMRFHGEDFRNQELGGGWQEAAADGELGFQSGDFALQVLRRGKAIKIWQGQADDADADFAVLDGGLRVDGDIAVGDGIADGDPGRFCDSLLIGLQLDQGEAVVECPASRSGKENGISRLALDKNGDG